MAMRMMLHYRYANSQFHFTLQSEKVGLVVDFPSSRCIFCFFRHVIRQFQHKATVFAIVEAAGFEPAREA